MTIKYPRHWAETYHMTRDRVDVSEATQFVKSVQSSQFGTLIEAHNMHVEEGSDPDNDPMVQTERQLQDDLDAVIEWLQELDASGQETISTRKVRKKIESETGYDFELTE